MNRGCHRCLTRTAKRDNDHSDSCACHTIIRYQDALYSCHRIQLLRHVRHHIYCWPHIWIAWWSKLQVLTEQARERERVKLAKHDLVLGNLLFMVWIAWGLLLTSTLADRVSSWAKEGEASPCSNKLCLYAVKMMQVSAPSRIFTSSQESLYESPRLEVLMG